MGMHETYVEMTIVDSEGCPVEYLYFWYKLKPVFQSYLEVFYDKKGIMYRIDEYTKEQAAKIKPLDHWKFIYN